MHHRRSSRSRKYLMPSGRSLPGGNLTAHVAGLKRCSANTVLAQRVVALRFDT